MPFKTRQKKESALSRRYAYIEAASSLSYNSAKEDISSNKPVNAVKKSKSALLDEDFFFVRHDLVKIVLVSFSIIVIQAAIKIAQSEGFIHF